MGGEGDVRSRHGVADTTRVGVAKSGYLFPQFSIVAFDQEGSFYRSISDLPESAVRPTLRYRRI